MSLRHSGREMEGADRGALLARTLGSMAAAVAARWWRKSACRPSPAPKGYSSRAGTPLGAPGSWCHVQGPLWLNTAAHKRSQLLPHGDRGKSAGPARGFSLRGRMQLTTCHMMVLTRRRPLFRNVLITLFLKVN